MPYGKSEYRVIRVTPTLDTNAYADDDVFFNATEIPQAVIGNGGCSELKAITILNEDDVAHDIDIVFMQVEKDLGTINDAVGSGSKWTNALAKAAGVLGVVKVDWSTNSEDLVNNLVYHTSSGNHGAAVTSGLPLFLQAADDSTSVYMAAVSRGGTPTVAADDYEFALHIQYR
tara:strand:+ start:23 stop:541 length:519 start_codon:yes stop_codon:yes gene_type:complete